MSTQADTASAHLEVQGLAVRYGAIRAVHDVTLEVRPREIVTLVGSNGAGKSSTLNAVAGLVGAAAGEIRLSGARVDGLRPWQLVARGLSLTPEGRQVFPRFTVEENLAIGRCCASATGRRPARCPAASSRCSPSGGRSCLAHGSSCWTSRRSASRP
jgi:branched-chain amino acid transport system ATP-binding protein